MMRLQQTTRRWPCLVLLAVAALGLSLLADHVLAAADKTPSKPPSAVPPSRNMANTIDKTVGTDFDVTEGQEKNVLWKATLGGTTYGVPVVAAGKVFVGTNNDHPRDPKITGDKGVLMCFDAKSGKFLWQAVHDKLSTGEVNDYPKQGIASGPAVEGDRLYYVSNRCELCCADVNGDGKGKAKFYWKLDMIGKLGVFPCQLAVCSPLVVGDLVFAVTGNGADVINDPRSLPAPNAPSFIAVNKKNGEVVWKDNSPGKNIMEGQWSNPVFAAPRGSKPQVIFPGGDGWLYSFDAVKPGKALWKFNCNPKKSVYNPQNARKSDRNSLLATPVVYEDKVYVGVGHDPQRGPGVGHLWCIDPTKSGDVSAVDDNFDRKAAVNKNSALVWHYGGRVLPRPQKGRDVYFGRTLATCAIQDGLLYVTELDGYVDCFDARTGKKIWTFDMRAETWCSAYWVAGKVFVGNDDGDLLIFDDGKALKEPKKITFSGQLSTPPVVAGGVLHVVANNSALSTLYAIGKK